MTARISRGSSFSGNSFKGRPYRRVMGTVKIGCAGWSYDDWAGTVYPATMSAAERLAHYATLFPMVEIDSTFYAIPPAPMVAGWIEKVRHVPGFAFTAKVPQAATHEAFVQADGKALRAVVSAFLERVIRPLEDAKRFEAVVVQLPPRFDAMTPLGGRDPLDALMEFLQLLEPRQRRVAVEFRNASWVDHVGERLAPEPLQALTGAGVGHVHVDGLGSRLPKTRTTNWTYVRLHGRRTQIPPSERELPHAPYDYTYAPNEVAEVARHVSTLRATDERTLVIFNNHYRGQAAKNAQDLADVLGFPPPKRRIKLANTPPLEEFR